MLIDIKKINTLQKLGRKHHTDKGSHHFKGVTYLHIYEIFLRRFRNNVNFNILELGVKKGASLRMWRDFFPRGEIYGLDLDSKCKQYEDNRIHIEIGHQDDKKVLEKLTKKAKAFDVILDDCSHLNSLTIASFNFLWPYVKPNGYYIIEDLRNSYTVDMEAEMKKGNWVSRGKQKKSTKLVNIRTDMDNLFCKLIKTMDYRTGDIGSVHFYPMICIIGKTGK